MDCRTFIFAIYIQIKRVLFGCTGYCGKLLEGLVRGKCYLCNPERRCTLLGHMDRPLPMMMTEFCSGELRSATVSQDAFSC